MFYIRSEASSPLLSHSQERPHPLPAILEHMWLHERLAATVVLAFATAACIWTRALSVPAAGPDIVVTIDRTTGDWDDLAMGPPSSTDDANYLRNPSALITAVPGFGRPDPESGAVGDRLPRLNDGKSPDSEDDHANNVWFDTASHSRILLDLGVGMDIARINVYSWHAGALSPQQYSLWASDLPAPSPSSSDLSRNWKLLASVDTRPLGDGGKHGSSINSTSGKIGHYRFLLFDVPANKPEWNRSGFFSQINVYRTGRVLPALRLQKREPNIQTLRFGPITIRKVERTSPNFLMSGRKIYEYGMQDGSFPRLGRENEQGGVWCHPIKLLDGFSFVVREAGERTVVLNGASRFAHDFASCRFDYVRNDIEFSRQDFAAEDQPALFSTLLLHNAASRCRTLLVDFSALVDLRPSWGSELPSPLGTVLDYDQGSVRASEKAAEGRWAVVFGSNRLPTQQKIVDRRATLTYLVSLRAHGDLKLRFLIVGEHEKGVAAAVSRFQALFSRGDKMLTAKRQYYRDRCLGGVRFSCSDQAVAQAFLCAKSNVLMSVMDRRPFFPSTYIAAGFPIYTWLFGCDSCYSTQGIASAGFRDEARGTLDCLLRYAAQANRAAHEVASDGRLLGFDHVQETPQLVLACCRHYLWTRDRTFLKKSFPICKAIIANILNSTNPNKDGYLEGPALMEEQGMGPIRLESVCYLYAAYQSLAVMAEALGEPGSEEYRLEATLLKQRFNRDWWNPVEKMWACSLQKDHRQTMDNYWSVIFPQQVEIADNEKARIALKRICKEWVNDRWGYVAQLAPDISGSGAGIIQNNECALTLFQYGNADLGTELLRLSAKGPLEERMLGAFDETLPGGGDLIQLWSFGPYMEAIISGLVGIQPTAAEDEVSIFPQMPKALTHYDLRNVPIGSHKLSVAWRREGVKNLLTITHSEGAKAMQVLVRLNIQAPIDLDGIRITPQISPYLGMDTIVVRLSLPPKAARTIQIDP